MESNDNKSLRLSCLLCTPKHSSESSKLENLSASQSNNSTTYLKFTETFYIPFNFPLQNDNIHKSGLEKLVR